MGVNACWEGAKKGARVFSVVLSGIRGTGYKLKYRKFGLNIRKTYILCGLTNTGTL